MKSKIASLSGVVVVLVLACASVVWARTFTMRATPVAPGATGTIDAKAEKTGGNTSLSIKVDHLARPTLLTPPANSYVVWIEPNEGNAENVGTLMVDENEKGDLKTTTTASKFSVTVTAEDQPHPKSPSHRVVLRSEVVE